jgi:hypothetical protein
MKVLNLENIENVGNKYKQDIDPDKYIDLDSDPGQTQVTFGFDSYLWLDILPVGRPCWYSRTCAHLRYVNAVVHAGLKLSVVQV